MVSTDVTKDAVSRSRFFSCGICFLKITATHVLCVICNLVYWSEKVTEKVFFLFTFYVFLHYIFSFYCTENVSRHSLCSKVKEISERQWIRKKCYVKKWKHLESLHI